jgi:hypothetical protein
MPMIKSWKLPQALGNVTVQSGRPLNGKLVAVYFKYDVTPNAATDVVIATVNEPAKTLLTLTNNVTSGWYYPRYLEHDEAGVALTGTAGGDRAKHPIDDHIKATVSGGDSDQTLDTWVYVEC